MARKAKWAVTSVILVLILGAWVVQLHFISDNAGATLFQRGNEAYLFLGAGHTGWHFPALLYPLVMAKGYLHIPADISDQYGQSLILRVTPEGVQRWEAPSTDISFLTPFEDGFYGLCPGSVLCKWTTGKGFGIASSEEEKRIGINDLHKGSPDNQVVNGWTGHVLKFSPGDHFEVRLDQNLVIAVQNRSMKDGAYRDVTVDLLRPGQAPENLYHADGFPRRVSKSEYEQLLGKR